MFCEIKHFRITKGEAAVHELIETREPFSRAAVPFFIRDGT